MIARWVVCCSFSAPLNPSSYLGCLQVEPDLSAAAGAIVDRFFGMDYEEGSDDEGDQDFETGAASHAASFDFGAKSGSDSQQQAGANDDGPRSGGFGRGVHMARPAWMQSNPS